MRIRHIWTPDEVVALERDYPDQVTRDIAKRMGMPIGKVHAKAKRMGLRKSPEFLASPTACRLDGVKGAASRFKPGQKPWNKGISYVVGGRSAETRFKRGSVPHTWVPIGSYRVNSDGYLDRKITDDGPAYKHWERVHRLVWIEAHGEIPAGHVVAFKRNRRTTELAAITPEALECISRHELARRNTIHRYPPALKDAIRLAAKLRRRIDEEHR